MPIFDAFCHSLTTVATGGFSTNNNSIAHYNSFYIELTIILGMLLASLPFTIYLSSFQKGIKAFKDIQVFTFLILVLLFSLTLTVWNYFQNNIDFFTSFRLAFFNGISIMTGTGYTTVDFSGGDLFECFVTIDDVDRWLYWFVSWGIKVFRIQILFFLIVKELKKLAHLDQYFL